MKINSFMNSFHQKPKKKFLLTLQMNAHNNIEPLK